jgi:hypothetical protein
LSGASRLERLPNSFGKLTNLRNISLSDAASLETLPLQIFSGNLINLKINLSVSGASSPLPHASAVYMAAGFQFGDRENPPLLSHASGVYMTADFQFIQNVHINIKMSGDSSLEEVPLPNLFEDIKNVHIHFSLSDASSLERVPLPNFFGDIENVHLNIEIEKVNINMSGASSLETLPIFLGNLKNVYINMSLSGAFSLERLPLPNFLGDIEKVYMNIYFENVNINLAGDSSLETLPLPLPNFFGILRNVCFNLVSPGASSQEKLPLPSRPL